MSIGDVLTKLFLTILLSSVIGLERETRQKGAGLRTHILVAVGSTLIVLTSFHISSMYQSITPVDPSRIISGIITGVGFLCVGTVIRAGNHISGLTTAASLWISSGLGMAVGAGLYRISILFAIVAFLVLTGVRAIEPHIRKTTLN